jgi:hypothetical protein
MTGPTALAHHRHDLGRRALRLAGREGWLRRVFEVELHRLGGLLTEQLATTLSAISIPAVTPPPVMNLPSATTRARTGTAPSRARKSWLAQCVVARRPARRPAAASTSEPVQTEVT